MYSRDRISMNVVSHKNVYNRTKRQQKQKASVPIKTCGKSMFLCKLLYVVFAVSVSRPPNPFAIILMSWCSGNSSSHINTHKSDCRIGMKIWLKFDRFVVVIFINAHCRWENKRAAEKRAEWDRFSFRFNWWSP